MSYTAPFTFANESGQQPASQLDQSYAVALLGVNNAFLVGTLGARPGVTVLGQPRYYFATDAGGGTLYRENSDGSPWVQVAPAVNSVASGIVDQLSGLGMTWNSTTALTINPGAAASDEATIGNRALMTLAAAIQGTTAGTFVAGNAQPKLDAGTVAASTTYHVFAVNGTGGTDILFSTSPTAPALPGTFNAHKRRILSFVTDGSSNIRQVIQDGDYFRYAASLLDLNATNPGTAAVTLALTVPTGITVQAILNVQVLDSGAANGAHFSDLAANDEAPSLSAAPLYQASGVITSTTTGAPAGHLLVRTNTSAQVRYRLLASGTVTLRAATLGWWDRRGKG